MALTGRPPGNGRKKNMAMFSAMWKAGAMLFITMSALDKALQLYVCPPECYGREHTWNRPSTNKDQGKPSLDMVDPTTGQECVINYPETDNCFNNAGSPDVHEIISIERGPNTNFENGREGYDDSDAFIRFVKKNHEDVAREFSKALFEVEAPKKDEPILHTECGDFKKVFVSGRWTYVAQT